RKTALCHPRRLRRAGGGAAPRLGYPYPAGGYGPVRGVLSDGESGTGVLSFAMDDPQTEIGGNGRQLPVTSHTALASIRSGDPLRRDAELERLVQLYWKPVYSLIRRAWAATNEDAKDLTQ